jgi:hypothetical protein
MDGLLGVCLVLAGSGRDMVRRFPCQATSLVNQRRTNFLRPTKIGLVGRLHNLRMLDPTATKLTTRRKLRVHDPKISSADFNSRKALARCLFINDAPLGVI